MAEGEGGKMTKRERMVYLLERGWEYDERLLSRRWSRPHDSKHRNLLGAFVIQQAIDARAEREAEK